MNADKRTPHTDALDTLGSIISVNEKRDAIHLAVEPVIAGEFLEPGDHIYLRDGKAFHIRGDEGIGIVDPFLKSTISKGDRFWLIVYPRQITSLRHVWEHPAFPPSGELPSPGGTVSDKDSSEAWLRNFCATADCPGYDAVIAQLLDPVDQWDSDYLHFDGRDAHGDIPEEFWTHAEVVTGKKFDSWRPKHFSCSC